MFLIDIIRTTLRYMYHNKMRVALSLSGVVIGTAAVLASGAVVEGGRRAVLESLEKLGSNIVFIQDRHNWKEQDRGRGSRYAIPEMMTVADTDTLKNRFPEIAAVDPQLVGWGRINYLSIEIPVQIEGSTDAGKTIRRLELAEGRYIDAGDLERKDRVCVLGAATARRLFGDDPAVDRRIAVIGTYFNVVGVTREKGDLIRFDYDNKIIIPITTYQQRVGFGYINAVLIQTLPGTSPVQLKEELRETILSSLIRGRNDEDISVWCQDELLNEQKRILSILKILVIAVSALALMVSGTGIMNIMLISVVERTKEIGIRKAIGARQRSIVAQFIVESVLICGVGGLAGVVFGIFLAFQTIQASASAMPASVGRWTPVFLPQFFFLALGSALIVGLLAGIFPACKAAKLDPVDALRHE